VECRGVSVETLFGGDPTGALLMISTLSLPITVVLSLLVLHRYQRAVARSMQATAGGALATETDRRTALPVELPPLALQATDADTRPPVPAEARAWLARTRRSALQAAAVYAVAGYAHAGIATVVLFVTSGTEFLPLRTFFVWFILAWPLVPTVFFVAVGSRRLRVIGIAAYVLLALAISPVSWAELAILWGTFMGIPTLLLIGVGHRRLRSVGPLVLVATFLVLAGANFAFSLAANLALLISTDFGLGTAFGAGIVIAVIVVAAFIALAWRTLLSIAARYRRKHTSDLMLTLDAWWRLFTLWECLDFSAAQGPADAFVLVAFMVYKLVLALGFRLIAPKKSPDAMRLVLLRVFGFRKRSERLLDELGHKWRYAGPVTLISAPDLATGYVEPHEFLDWLSGRLSRSFVKSEEDLEARMATLDTVPDPDGRYRVNEFFCHADTWQLTMRRLARDSDAILMDLRSFSKGNRGCTYELRVLFDSVPVERTLLMIDATTDQFCLKELLGDLWRTLAPTSPNLGSQPKSLRIFSIRAQSARQINALLLELFRSGARCAPQDHRAATAKRPFV
jgi:hypothetical protein